MMINDINYNSVQNEDSDELIPGGFLVVDDVSINVFITQEMLTEYGLPIETASGGAEAVEKIRLGSEYDIIFMDHQMPEVNGIEATRAIRDMGYTGCIIALTANETGEYDDLYMKSGFNRILTKPIDKFELNEIIEQYVNLEEETDSGADNNSSIFVTFDDDDDDDLSKLFLMDAESAVETLEEMLAAGQIAEKDLNLYEITVHGIKSALRNIGEKDLGESAYRLELAAKAADTETINSETAAFLDELKVYMAKL